MRRERFLEESILRWTLTAGLLLLLAIAPSEASAAHHNGTQLRANGADLSISLGRRSYARDALVAVDVALRDVSTAPVSVYRDCFTDNPGVQVISPNGTVLFPPATVLAPPSCPPPDVQPFSLAPGSVVKHHLLVVLRSDQLQASALVYVGGVQTTMVTPLVHVKLHVGTGPQVTLRTSPKVRLVVRRPLAVKGPMFYNAWVNCGDGNGSGVGAGDAGALYPGQTMVEWHEVAVKGKTAWIDAGCQDVREWRVVAGWLNYPVASIDYVRR